MIGHYLIVLKYAKSAIFVDLLNTSGDSSFPGQGVKRPADEFTAPSRCARRSGNAGDEIHRKNATVLSCGIRLGS